VAPNSQEITVSDLDGVVVIRVSANTLLDEDCPLWAELDQLKKRDRLILVDLDLVATNSVGINLMFHAWNEAKRAGGRVAFWSKHADLRKGIREFMRTYLLSDTPWLFDTEDDAIAHLRGTDSSPNEP